MKFIKKPIVIEALHLHPNITSIKKILEFMGQTVNNDFITNEKFHEYCNNIIDRGYMEIDTLEGVMKANMGDYIIEGINGEFYPCKPDIFLKTYDPYEE